MIRPDPARGVLETIRVEERRALHLPDHLARLRASVRELYDIELGDELDAIVAATLPTRPQEPCRMRVIASSTGVLQAELAPLGPAADPGPVLLAPWTVRGGLGAHKWADRRAIDEATRRLGATPLIADEDGAVLEAAWGNVWAREGDRLLTPPADGRLLPGVARARMLRTDPGATEEPLTLGRLEAAEVIVLTSALRGAVEARLQRGRARPIT